MTPSIPGQAWLQFRRSCWRRLVCSETDVLVLPNTYSETLELIDGYATQFRR